MKILVADDDATSRKILSVSLARLGHVVEVVEDGAQAWDRLAGDDLPELVILDWHMPGLDGPEICRKLRQHKAQRYVYAILVTSRSSPHHAAEGLEAGADDFVAKPIDPEELCARVRAGQRIVELQAEMNRSRAYLHSILANIDQGVLLMDHCGTVVYANESLLRMSGTPLDATLGLKRDDFIRIHAARFDDPSVLTELLGVGRAVPLEAQGDFEVARPEPRTFRWLGKPVDLPEGRGQLDLYRDVTDEVAHERDREYRARVDYLTGLYNRRAADEMFAREISRSRRAGRPLSIALCDIDLFKRVNDTFGHNTGDRVLREVSRVVSECCRITDVAIRWGGEELLVLLADTSLSGALLFAERLRASVEMMQLPDLPRVTVSCGVAEVLSGDVAFEVAVGRADARLYEAKASGRNAVR